MSSREVLSGAPDLSSVCADDGTSWFDIRRTLEPRYGQVWSEIVLCHLGIVSGYAAVLACECYWPVWVAASAMPFAAFWIAFWLHALLAFGHEAAHGNLAHHRRWNDRLANAFVWPFFGQSVAQYRKVHWQHHLHLGNPKDTEISYHHCLSTWFMIQSLTGWHLLVTFFRHKTAASRSEPGDAESSRERNRPPGGLKDRAPALRSAVLHFTAVAIPLWFGKPLVAGTWFLAVVVFFPFLTTLRQLVEHRDLRAPCGADVSRPPFGPVNRMFGTGLVARYFGAAGFNRHLLHHWDPTVSYTRFDEMEAFLRRTPLAEALNAHRSTYPTAMFGLLRRAQRG